jgi:N-acetylmuramoyl-L-alanine amidase
MARHCRTAVAALALAAAACTPVPPRFTPGVPVTRVASPNFDLRRPQFVILHHTSDDTAARALATLTDPARMVSAHYLVARDGTIYQLVDERDRAWHAGTARWGSDSDINSSSIGIELDNDGAEPYPPAQVRALLALLRDLEARYEIPRENFLGHGDVAPGRKIDPGALFPWKVLADHGFGMWCDDAVTPAQPFTPAQPVAPAPAGAQGMRRDDADLLAIVGYDVSRLDAAIRAFNRHFMALEDEPVLSPSGRAMLECLARARTEPSP